MRPDTVAWGGRARGAAVERAEAMLGDGRLYVHEHRRGREVSGSTCTIAGQALCPSDAWDLADAMEAVAEFQLDFPRLSRLDLARDVSSVPIDVVRGMAHRALCDAVACWFYWTDRRRGITLFPDGLDRLRVYDKGLESGLAGPGEVWRIEAQLRRAQLHGCEKVREAESIDRHVWGISRRAVAALGWPF